ncbi:protein THALLO isoform X1 [Rhododendron vialii]|uniref:protein THALLO isoform X1 n=1 Tax=Rhododendron vialii TaxID=182163 RepID=UPI00265E802F|nr:protein THALLO isoform X1 [Rhododendron vialii]
MGRGRKGPKGDSRNPKKRATKHDVAPDYDMMDDEIDAFHKQRDVIPLNISDDIGASDEDDEHLVFDIQDEEEEDEDIDDDTRLTGTAAKMARTQRYLHAKIGGVEDEMHDDVEDEEKQRVVWRRGDMYNADNMDYELQSSDEDQPAAEEAEVLRLRKENAKSLSLEDFGLEDVSQDESNGEPTLEEVLVKGKAAPKASAGREAHDGPGSVYQEVEKDLNALTKEEQMDVVYSSAPELVGLLSELNDAFEELENKVNPLLRKVKEWGNAMKGGMHYMEVKQLLLLAYCQSITFYLLLKAEGQPVRDHPVIARLVEIKNLLDNLKQLDGNLPSELEDILSKKDQTVLKSLREDVAPTSDSLNNFNKPVVRQGATVIPHEEIPKLMVDSSKDIESNRKRRKHLTMSQTQSDHIGVQSMEMLKVRAALEEKLKQKCIFGSIASKRDKVQKRSRLLNGQLETIDDFDDDAADLGKGTAGMSKGHATSMSSSKPSQLVIRQSKKTKIISGDDDLPKRDDIGERRRKHELRVLAGAGVESGDEVGDGPGTLGSDEDKNMEFGESESEDDLYKQVKQQRASKLAAAKSKITAAIPPMPEEALVDGKRHITYQMEKNRGLTRARKKAKKNPRKNYKNKHAKAVVRRKGQVRDIKKPAGPYGGEASGINAGISRSIRFKS